MQENEAIHKNERSKIADVLKKNYCDNFRM